MVSMYEYVFLLWPVLLLEVETVGDLLTCCDLSLAFFGLVLYFTEKFHCLIPEGQKVSLLQVFNLRVDIDAERLSWTWYGVLMCTQKYGNQ